MRKLLIWLGLIKKPVPFDPINAAHLFYHDDAPVTPPQFRGFESLNNDR